MGCGHSLPFDEMRKKIQLEAVEQLLDSYGMTRQESNELYTAFDTLDASGDGHIQKHEFLKKVTLPDMANIESSAQIDLKRRLFDLFDANTNGEIAFSEFIKGLLKYCSLSKYSLLLFAFDLLTADGNATVDPYETVVLVQQMKLHAQVRLVGMDKISVHDLMSGRSMEHRINLSKWLQFCLKNPAILYPAARLQDELRAQTGGVDFWRALTQRRIGPDQTRQVATWLQKLRENVLQNSAFPDALVMTKDGIRNTALAPWSDVETMRKMWTAHFLPADKGVGRALVGESTPEQRLAAMEAARKEKALRDKEALMKARTNVTSDQLLAEASAAGDGKTASRANTAANATDKTRSRVNTEADRTKSRANTEAGATASRANTEAGGTTVVDDVEAAVAKAKANAKELGPIHVHRSKSNVNMKTGTPSRGPGRGVEANMAALQAAEAYETATAAQKQEGAPAQLEHSTSFRLSGADVRERKGSANMAVGMWLSQKPDVVPTVASKKGVKVAPAPPRA